MDPARNSGTSQPNPGGGSKNHDPSWSSTDGQRIADAKQDGTGAKAAGGGKERLLSKVAKMKNWLATSEPSTQALLQHKKETFQRAGIPLNDPGGQASTKLHAPIGEIPAHAINPAGGPSPEELVRKRRAAAERQRRQDGSSYNSAAAAGSLTSRSSSGLSTTSASSQKGSVWAPWDDGLPFDGSNRGGSGLGW